MSDEAGKAVGGGKRQGETGSSLPASGWPCLNPILNAKRSSHGWRIWSVCLWCEAEFSKSSHAFKRKRVYCSRECANKAHSSYISQKHPRGFLGHTHSQQTRDAQSVRATAIWANKSHKLNSAEHKMLCRERVLMRLAKGPLSRAVHSRGVVGHREDLGGFFRSTWEANVARYLNHVGIRWEYEPKWFEFPVKRGTTMYKPDFYLPGSGEWLEVKGWLIQRAFTALKRFKKYYPDEAAKMGFVVQSPLCAAHKQLLAIGYSKFTFYSDIRKFFKPLINNWEGD